MRIFILICCVLVLILNILQTVLEKKEGVKPGKLRYFNIFLMLVNIALCAVILARG